MVLPLQQLPWHGLQGPQLLQTFVSCKTFHLQGRDRPHSPGMPLWAGAEVTSAHGSCLSFRLSQPVLTARAGAALPHSLGTPGPSGTTSSYGTALCSGTFHTFSIPNPGHSRDPHLPWGEMKISEKAS